MQTRPSKKDIAEKIRHLKREIEILKKAVKNNSAKGVSRLSLPPYEVLILDLAKE
jgi:hypothetical protein